MLTTVVIVVLVLLGATVFLVLERTWLFPRSQPDARPLEHPVDVDADAVARHVSDMIQVPIVSRFDGAPPEPQLFDRLCTLLQGSYPLTHRALRREIIGQSLLYQWQGTNPDLEPVLFAAHEDVVPVDPETVSRWQVDPFAGTISDGSVWGRGALDDKSPLVTIFEAIEALLRRGFVPARTVYLAVGQDEESGGQNGAQVIAATLKRQGVHLEAVLDAGGAIVDGVLPGVRGSIALVGTSEKGYLSLRLRADAPSGHADAPSRDLAVERIARAVISLLASPFRPHLDLPAVTYHDLGTAVSWPMQMAFSNLWLFSALARRQLDATGPGSAAIRTTIAPTMLRAGTNDNVLPGSAEAVVNLRLFPGESIAGTIEHVRQAIRDPGITIETLPGASEPSPVSPDDGFAFNRLADTIRQVFPDALVAPYLVQSTSDARHYAALCANVYRFSPLVLDEQALATIHGENERVATRNLGTMVQFYARLADAWGAYELTQSDTRNTSEAA